MSAIACLYIRPTEAVCNICGELTPIVEPSLNRIYMDWTGCGDVVILAKRLAERLHSLTFAKSGNAHQIKSIYGDKSADGGKNAHDGKSTYVGTKGGSGKSTYVDRRAGSSKCTYVEQNRYDTNNVDPLAAQTTTRAFATYRLGVAPIRFAADVLATAGDKIMTATRITGGYYVDKRTMSAFLQTLPVPLLPDEDIDGETKRTLRSLAVDTLGQLRRVDQDLLRLHIGHVADKLLAWSKGDDRRPVSALYPPPHLHKRIDKETIDPSGANLQAVITAALLPLIAQLHTKHQVTAQLIVSTAGYRQSRTFTPPVSEGEQLVRIARRMTEQLLMNIAGEGTWREIDDVIIEIVPTDKEKKQMTLWGPDSGIQHSARSSPPSSEPKQRTAFRYAPRLADRDRAALDALDTIRHRFRDIIVNHTATAAPIPSRESVARYEAMFRLYGLNG